MNSTATAPIREIEIVSADPGGQILKAYVGQAPIHGQYDAAAGAISFNDARQPGDTGSSAFQEGKST